MEDKKLKKKLAKIPDVDQNGDPIFKIAETVVEKKNADKSDENKIKKSDKQ